MVKLELYKIAQKNGLPDILVPDRDCLDVGGMVLSWGDVSGKKALSNALTAAERDEGLEIILQVGSQQEADNLLEKTMKNYSTIKKINESPAVKKEVAERIRDTLYDTVGKEDMMNSQMAGGKMNYILNAMSSSRGFRGTLHKLFPMLFILHQIPAFQPMVWVMLLFSPKNHANCKRDIAEHYSTVERGVNIMYSDVKITPKLNRYSLGLVNNIIRSDENGEGYNNAYRIAQKLTLPQAVIDQLHISTQATEDTQWNVYQKAPVGFATLPLDIK
jgi:hypothetical protein